MLPTTESALIAAASAGGVAIASFVATAWNTARTLRASRESAGEARLWAKISEVYEEILADTTYLQLVRDHNTSDAAAALDSEARAGVKAQLDKFAASRTDFVTLDARVRAYASDAVLQLFLKHRDAEREVNRIHGEWIRLTALYKENPAAPEAAALPTFKPMLDTARATADAALVKLGLAVRKELREGHLRPLRWYNVLKKRAARKALKPGQG